MVNENRAGFYEQFGSRRVSVANFPRFFAGNFHGRIVTTLMSPFRRDRVHIIPLKRR